MSLLLAKGRGDADHQRLKQSTLIPSCARTCCWLATLLYVIELLDRFTYEGGRELGPLPPAGRHAGKPSPQAKSSSLVVRFYEVRLLDLLGFRPQLFTLRAPGVEIKPEDQYFSAEEGGVLCPACGKGTVGARPISMLASSTSGIFNAALSYGSKRAQLSQSISREMEILMQHYLTYLLERGLKYTVISEAGQAGRGTGNGDWGLGG